MDRTIYRKYLEEYVREAIDNSDGSMAGIVDYLRSKVTPKGFLTRHKEERSKALADALLAFEEHRHWPVHIVLSHLGMDARTP